MDDIILSKKKTCNKCKALKEGQGELLGCVLNYNINNMQGIPLEICPKPKTYNELIECQKWYMKSK